MNIPKHFVSLTTNAILWTPLYWGCSLLFPIAVASYAPNIHPTIGLVVGLSSVGIGQIVTLIYHFTYNNIPLTKTNIESTKTFISKPEGLLLLGGYLSIYWFSGYMPSTYYTNGGGIKWTHVFYQLLIQDACQYGMHRIEHAIPLLYTYAHKHHHKHINPTLMDAFDCSIMDTTCMVLIPLVFTSRLVHTNMWSYMVFGTIYANMLTLIHSDVAHPWEPFARLIGIGTTEDHRLHHQLFKCNYGHIFTYWDWVCNTISQM